MGRAAADSSSRGKSYSNAQRGFAARRKCNRQALQLFEPLACNGKRLSFGRATPVFFLGKENGGRITRHLCRIDIRTCAKKEEFSFEKENIPLLNPQEKGFRLAVSGANDLYASGMQYLRAAKPR